MGFGGTGVYCASQRVVDIEVHHDAVLLAAAQGGPELVTVGEGGEYRHLQTQCRADKRLPQRLFAWGGGETMEDMCYERL